MIYTGGTTGMPKGVMWRQEDMFYALGGGIDAYSNEKVDHPDGVARQDRPTSAGPGVIAAGRAAHARRRARSRRSAA